MTVNVGGLWGTLPGTFEETMGDTPSFNDRFARRSAPGGKGFGPAQDHFRKADATHASDPFAKRAKPAKLAKIAKAAKGPKGVAKAPPSDPFGQKAKGAQPTMSAPARDPFARAPLRPPQTRTPPPAAPKPTPAARVAPIAAAASFYNPFGKPESPKAARTPAHVESPRTPLHVVPQAPVEAVATKPRPAGRTSSLVLISSASAVAAAETLEAPPPAVEKPPEPPTAVLTPIPPEPRKRAGGGGPPGGGRPPRGGAAVALSRRGFNQDDLFGVIFGVAVIIFLLMWLMRGRSEEALPDEGLAGVQSAANQQLMATPPPAPLVDPYGNAPVDLRPSGPIPAPLPEPEAAIAEATPPPAAAPAAPPAAAPASPPIAAKPTVTTPASPPQAAVAPSLSLTERKMNGWFCTASSTLTRSSKAALETELATFAEVFAGKELIVRGYADTRGSTEFNAALGGERAKVVADFLRTKGLTVAEFTGIGELDGLDDNQNCPNQRRVDVWVKGGPAAAPSRECMPEPEAAKLACN
jgi:outer membrane protein OmpA-like peptidoglycan-associated protein